MKRMMAVMMVCVVSTGAWAIGALGVSWTVPKFATWGTSDGSPMVYGVWEMKMGRLPNFREDPPEPDYLLDWASYENMVYKVNVVSGFSGGEWMGYDPALKSYNEGRGQSRCIEHYGEWPHLYAEGSNWPPSDWRSVPTLVFTAPENGIYQVSASDQSKGVEGRRGYERRAEQGGQMDRYFKVALDGTMTELTRIVYPTIGSYWVEPQLNSELQNVPLLAGEKIALVVVYDSDNGSWWNARLYTGDNKSNTTHGFYTITLVDVLVVDEKIPGDANNDSMVDVGDLGILAANYGTLSGATWEQGDFNEDGAVDVGDLGILAANYGTGTNGTNWNADYAKAFGTAVQEDAINDSSVCSGLGLPLLAGLFLMSLALMVRQEE